MPRRKVSDRDGVFTRKGSYYISFIDAQGCRRQRKLKGTYTLTQARALRAAEQQKVEKAQTLGYVPPTRATFAEIVPLAVFSTAVDLGFAPPKYPYRFTRFAL